MSASTSPSPVTHPPGSNQPLLSIIVPTYNNLSCTQEMYASLQRTMPNGLDYELIFVDDGSTDGTRDWLSTLSGPGTQVLLNETNLGFSGANNRGATAALGEYLGLLNNDLIMEPQWLEPMLKVFERHGSRVGIVGNIQTNASTDEVDHAGLILTRHGKIKHLRKLPSIEQEDMEVVAVTAACCLLRRKDFLDAGGFDEGFINGGEDVDLAFRLKALGKTCHVALKSRVRHHVSATRGPTSLKDELNSRRLYKRWHSALRNTIALQWLPSLGTDPSSGFFTKLCTFAYSKGFWPAPPRTAVMFAESALWREEFRWRSLFDAPAVPPTASEISVKGPKISSPNSPPYLSTSAKVSLPSGAPGQSIIFCGHLSPGDQNASSTLLPLGLRVTINGIQRVEWFPISEGNFNLSINNPASLPDRASSICIELLGAGFSSWIRPLAWILSFVPTSSDLGRNLDAMRRNRLEKRLRLSRIVFDDHYVVDLIDGKFSDLRR